MSHHRRSNSEDAELIDLNDIQDFTVTDAEVSLYELHCFLFVIRAVAVLTMLYDHVAMFLSVIAVRAYL